MDIETIVNKQFEMIGASIRIEDVPEHGMILDEKKKKRYWYDIYLFDSIEQYEEWREWAREQLKRQLVPEDVEKELNYIDLRYGLKYRITKKEP